VTYVYDDVTTCTAKEAYIHKTPALRGRANTSACAVP
jgi:hypothetical protein